MSFVATHIDTDIALAQWTAWVRRFYLPHAPRTYVVRVHRVVFDRLRLAVMLRTIHSSRALRDTTAVHIYNCTIVPR